MATEKPTGINPGSIPLKKPNRRPEVRPRTWRNGYGNWKKRQTRSRREIHHPHSMHTHRHLSGPGTRRRRHNQTTTPPGEMDRCLDTRDLNHVVGRAGGWITSEPNAPDTARRNPTSVLVMRDQRIDGDRHQLWTTSRLMGSLLSQAELYNHRCSHERVGCLKKNRGRRSGYRTYQRIGGRSRRLRTYTKGTNRVNHLTRKNRRCLSKHVRQLTTRQYQLLD